MTTKIESPRYVGYPAQSTDMKILLGQGKNWPDAGLPVQVVQGVKVWVKPIVRVPGRKSSKHRVMCECPNCNTILSVGRLNQHVCKEQVA